MGLRSAHGLSLSEASFMRTWPGEVRFGSRVTCAMEDLGLLTGDERSCRQHLRRPAPEAAVPDMNEELAQWDLLETRARVAAREVSSPEVIEAAIARAELWEPHIHAIVTPTFSAARAQAGEGREGAFAGLPTFIKDLDDIEGVPTGMGSGVAEAVPPTTTSPSVRQHLATGLISLGKSSTPELGLTCTTEPVHGEATHNPWALDRTAGGSSGGAAALVASGVVPIAYASDGGGSIRIPASFCGLVGLKPSRGRLAPIARAKMMPVKIATVGVVTRTVRDTATFYGEVEKIEPARGMPPVGLVEGAGKERLRVGMYTDSPGDDPVDPEIVAAVEATGLRLEGMGHKVEAIAEPFGRDILEDFVLYWSLLAAGGIRLLRKRAGAGFDPEHVEPWTRTLAQQLRSSWPRLPGALFRMRRFTNTYARVFQGFDLLLSPVLCGPAPLLGHLSPAQTFEEKLPRLRSLVTFTPVHNITGAPSISLPVARMASGLPIGVQIAAPVGMERHILEVAFELEDWSPRPASL